MRTPSSRSRIAWQPRIQATLSAPQLQANYHAIRKLIPGQELLPMVKANAYGHGAVWAAAALEGLPGLAGFGVATLDEGAELREALGRRSKIVVFSGALPWTDEKGQYCERYGLTPVIASDEDWAAFLRGGWPARIPYELKFNTGMNRLGLTLGIAKKIVQALRDRPASWHPEGVLSHLAIAEKPDHRLSLGQRRKFESLRGLFEPALPGTRFHIGNSSAIWNSKKWRLDGLSDLARPGLSLYGVPPWPGAPARGIGAVMTLEASVGRIFMLQPGESLGYGASFAVRRDEAALRVGILSAGYADGILRALSGRGHAWVSGRSARFLGRVSMDLSAIRLPGATRVGDLAELMGPHIDPWTQAEAAGTIPYELLTSVSSRVQRVHV